MCGWVTGVCHVKRSYLEGFLSVLMVVTGIEFIGFLDV